MTSYYLFILTLIGFVVTSCEDVIDVDLQTAPPKLVIDASINWEKGTLGDVQQIKLSLTAPFFQDSVPPANDAIVTITDQDGNVFNFIEQTNSGIYMNTNFAPVLNSTYNLSVLYNGELYEASTILLSVVDIETVEQKNDGGFSGDDIEIKVFYTDVPEVKNFYLFEFFNDGITTLEVYDDQFTDGNTTFAFYSNEDLVQGDELIIKNYGVTLQYYEYLNILLEQINTVNSGPFQVQPAIVRGNCVNKTNPNNFPLGYFRASEVDIITYQIQ